MSIALLVGASGSGKSTIGKALEENGLAQLVSFTTRPMREGEEYGVDYYFVNRLQLRMMHLIESSEYSGNIYGLSRDEVDNKLKSNEHVYFITDKHGAEQISEAYPDETVYFWLLVSPETMIKRMKQRGDSEENIVKRLTHAHETGEFAIPDTKGIHILDSERSVKELVAEILENINR